MASILVYSLTQLNRGIERKRRIERARRSFSYRWQTLSTSMTGPAAELAQAAAVQARNKGKAGAGVVSMPVVSDGSLKPKKSVRYAVDDAGAVASAAAAAGAAAAPSTSPPPISSLAATAQGMPPSPFDAPHQQQAPNFSSNATQPSTREQQPEIAGQPYRRRNHKGVMRARGALESVFCMPFRWEI